MKVRILQPTRCNGKRYQAGETVDFDRGVATGLIEAGSAEMFDAKAAAKTEAASKAAAEAQAAADAAAQAAATAELLKANGGQPPADA